MFDYGIGENDIVAIKGISDFILTHKGNDTTKKLNVKPEVIMDLSIYSNNSKLEKENLEKRFFIYTIFEEI